MRVKIGCQAIKLILTGFVVVQENIKPSVLMHRPYKLGLYFKDLGLHIFLYNIKPVNMRIIQEDSIHPRAQHILVHTSAVVVRKENQHHFNPYIHAGLHFKGASSTMRRG